MYRPSVVGRKDPCSWCEKVAAELAQDTGPTENKWGTKLQSVKGEAKAHRKGSSPYAFTAEEHKYARGVY
jgi:hypothetical protein